MDAGDCSECVLAVLALLALLPLDQVRPTGGVRPKSAESAAGEAFDKLAGDAEEEEEDGVLDRSLVSILTTPLLLPAAGGGVGRSKAGID